MNFEFLLHLIPRSVAHVLQNDNGGLTFTNPIHHATESLSRFTLSFKSLPFVVEIRVVNAGRTRDEHVHVAVARAASHVALCGPEDVPGVRRLTPVRLAADADGLAGDVLHEVIKLRRVRVLVEQWHFVPVFDDSCTKKYVVSYISIRNEMIQVYAHEEVLSNWFYFMQRPIFACDILCKTLFHHFIP